MYKQIGAQVRRYRKEQGLTQEELAAQAGISASFLGHIERGTRVLSVDTLMRLCQAMRVTPNELLCTEAMLAVRELPDAVQPFAMELVQNVIDVVRKYYARGDI